MIACLDCVAVSGITSTLAFSRVLFDFLCRLISVLSVLDAFLWRDDLEINGNGIQSYRQISVSVFLSYMARKASFSATITGLSFSLVLLNALLMSKRPRGCPSGDFAVKALKKTLVSWIVMIFSNNLRIETFNFCTSKHRIYRSNMQTQHWVCVCVCVCVCLCVCVSYGLP